MGIGRSYSSLVRIFFALIFLSYYLSVSLFFHTHRIDGATIVHSHPYADSHKDTPEGGHTKQSITFISQVSSFEYVDFSCEFLPIPSQLLLIVNQIVEHECDFIPLNLEILSPRAPPAV